MNRDLLNWDGRARTTVPSFIANRDGALLHTDGTGTFDPIFLLSSGPTIQWDLGDSTTNTNNSVSHTYASTGNYAVTNNANAALVTRVDVRTDGVTTLTTDIGWSSMAQLYCYSNKLTLLNTYPEWTAMSTFYIADNDLEAIKSYGEWTALVEIFVDRNNLKSFETHPEWTLLGKFYFRDNSLTALETHAEWVNMTQLIGDTNSITSFETHAEWTSLQHAFVYSNNMTSFVCHAAWPLIRLRIYNCELTTLNAESAWTAVTEFWCHNNDLPATEIDDILTAFEAGTINGASLNYSGNPGAGDGCRSGPAATAKANLVTRGWTVTI